MDKALKQRLVGATVLIILAVIILPMLMSGRSETLKQESRQIELPAKPDELSIETRRFPVGVPNRAEPSPAESTEASGQTDGPGQASARVVETPAIQSPSTTTVDVEPELAAESPPAVTTITLPADERQTNVMADPDTGTQDTPRYLVQVASFSEEKNANALAQQLRQKNLPVVMDVVNRVAGRMHRVRVGPYARRTEADTVVSDIKTEIPELAPRVLDLRPDDVAPVTTPSDPLVRWVVQVGSFSNTKAAETLVAKLRDANLHAFSEQVTTSSGVVYKVKVGPEISRENALELASKLKQEHGLDDSFVTTSD